MRLANGIVLDKDTKFGELKCNISRLKAAQSVEGRVGMSVSPRSAPLRTGHDTFASSGSPVISFHKRVFIEPLCIAW